MRAIFSRNVVLITLLCAGFYTAFTPAESLPGSADAAHVAILDANEISMCFSNYGLLAYNDTMPAGQRQGFIYPADSGFALMYSAWLWLAAEVDSSVRVALVESRSEFAPGPFGHPPVEDSTIFKVYKISSADADSQSQDRDNWPVSWGAPVDSSGQPKVTGDQSIWTVFNDSDILRHTRQGGSTVPLGAEVQLYAYAYGTAGLLDQIVFLEYTIINRSSHDWINFMASVLGDPDLGEAADDMGCTDSARSLVCCYSYEHDNHFPLDFYPAVGLIMLVSPSSENGGETSGSAAVLKNYYASHSLEETINVLSGKDPSGAEYIDPTTGVPTKYPYGGDPRTGTGWLDHGKADRRIVITSAPADVLAGDTTHLTVAFLAARGGNNPEALVKLYKVAAAAHDFHDHGLSGLHVMMNIPDGSVRSVSFDPPEQMWFRGRDWGGSSLEGGIGWAGELWGSSRRRSDNVDVELIFDPHDGQKACRFVKNLGTYRFADYVTIPFTCRRTSDSAALSILFIDSDLDGKWSLGGSGREPELILVTHSLQGPAPPVAYANALFPNDALNTDLMYAISLEVRPKYESKNIRTGQRLTVSAQTESEPLPADTIHFGNVIVGHSKSMLLYFNHSYSVPKKYEFSIDDSQNFKLQKRSVSLNDLDTGRASILFTPADTTVATAVLTIITPEYNLPVGSIVLTGSGVPWPLPGDIYTNGILDLIDATTYMSYLYRGPIMPPNGVPLDLDGSGDVSLSDLVVLIDIIFRHD